MRLAESWRLLTFELQAAVLGISPYGHITYYVLNTLRTVGWFDGRYALCVDRLGEDLLGYTVALLHVAGCSLGCRTCEVACLQSGF